MLISLCQQCSSLQSLVIYRKPIEHIILGEEWLVQFLMHLAIVSSYFKGSVSIRTITEKAAGPLSENWVGAGENTLRVNLPALFQVNTYISYTDHSSY